MVKTIKSLVFRLCFFAQECNRHKSSLQKLMLFRTKQEPDLSASKAH